MPPNSTEDAIFGMSYDYCTNNWCVNNQADSIFTYGEGESFEELSQCDVPYINEIEDQVADPPEEIVATCGLGNIACIRDEVCWDNSTNFTLPLWAVRIAVRIAPIRF